MNERKGDPRLRGGPTPRSRIRSSREGAGPSLRTLTCDSYQPLLAHLQVSAGPPSPSHGLPCLGLPDRCPLLGDSWLPSSALTQGRGAVTRHTPGLGTQRGRGSPGPASRGLRGRAPIGLRPLLLRRRRVRGQAPSRDGGPPQRRFSPPHPHPSQRRGWGFTEVGGPFPRTSSV